MILHQHCTVLVKLSGKIIFRFLHLGNLYVARPHSSRSLASYSVTLPRHSVDWHLVLGHPSDEYLRRFLSLHSITNHNPEFSSANCKVCKTCKIKHRPHSNPLPASPAPFHRLHLDVLQITPPSKHGMRYLLVIIDDYSRFNCIHVMKSKSDSESRIVSYIQEIRNQARRIVLEQGPAHSPQTNGLAERFNQTILTKIRCLLAQSAVPISYWDKAARYLSTLINLLPSKSIGWSSPVGMLVARNCTIEPVREIAKLIPFGLKVQTLQPVSSKILPRSSPLLFLRYKQYSDAGRFLHPLKKNVTITRDFHRPQAVFEYGNPLSLKKLPTSLPQVQLMPLPDSPSEVCLPLQCPASPLPVSNSEASPSPAAPVISAVPQVSANPAQLTVPEPPLTTPSPGSVAEAPPPKHYAYVPYSSKAPREISSSLDPSAILPVWTCSAARTTDGSADMANFSDSNDDNDGLLLEVISVKEVFADASERPLWLESMAGENSSLINCNTGTLVPPPKDNIVISGMWHLVQKRNEFGEVVCRKSCWVCFGNHQEYPQHYLDTYLSVGCTKSLKSLLVVAVQRQLHLFQFDVETAFLYGNIDETVHVAQVAGFEVPGKEKWVWRLNKSLYGTKQAPQCWKSNFSATLAKLGLTPLQGDESLFVTNNRHMMLHIHVDDGLLHDFCLKTLHKLKMDMANSVKAPAPLNLHHLVLCDSLPFNVKTMKKAVGMLIHLSINTQPNISFAVNMLSRYANSPTKAHWNVAKHLLQYLKGTSSLGIHFKRTKGIKQGLCGWADTNYGTSAISRKSTTGYIITLFGKPIFWAARKQPIVAQSTTEAEFVAMNSCAKEMRQLSSVLLGLGIQIPCPVIVNNN